MVETTRVEKYRDYRQEIIKKDNPSLCNPKKTAINNKKNSLEKNKIIPQNTTSISFEELMSEHSKYVDEENLRLKEIEASRETRKKRMMIFLLVSFALFCLIVIGILIFSIF